jgi:hypothetical protein
MEKIAFIACVAVALGCNKGQDGKPRAEGHVGSSEVSETGDPRLTEAAGGQGSGPTGTGGTGEAEPNPEGAGDSQGESDSQ